MGPRCKEGSPRRGSLAAVPGERVSHAGPVWSSAGAVWGLAVTLSPLPMGGCTSRHPSRGMMGCGGLSVKGRGGSRGEAQWARL